MEHFHSIIRDEIVDTQPQLWQLKLVLIRHFPWSSFLTILQHHCLAICVSNIQIPRKLSPSQKRPPILITGHHPLFLLYINDKLLLQLRNIRRNSQIRRLYFLELHLCLLQLFLFPVQPFFVSDSPSGVGHQLKLGKFQRHSQVFQVLSFGVLVENCHFLKLFTQACAANFFYSLV